MDAHERVSGPVPFDPSRYFNMWFKFAEPSDPATGRFIHLVDLDRRRIEQELKLVSAKVTRTTAPVTRSIERQLPWLARLQPRNDTIELGAHRKAQYHEKTHHAARGAFTQTRH